LNERSIVIGNTALFKLGHELPTTVFTAVVLFTIVNVTVFRRLR
jgi:hypothetical protein